MPRGSTKKAPTIAIHRTAHRKYHTTNYGTQKPVTLHNHRNSNTGLKRQTKLVQVIHSSKCIIRYNMFTNQQQHDIEKPLPTDHEFLSEQPNNIPSIHHKHIKSTCNSPTFHRTQLISYIWFNASDKVNLVYKWCHFELGDIDRPFILTFLN